MRVLMVNYEFPPVGGGGGNANYYLAREMVRLGHDVTVVTSWFRDLAREEMVEGIRIVRVKLHRKRKDFTAFHEMLQYVLFALPVVRSLGRREHFDLVVTFFAVPSGPVGVAAARAARAPLVVRLGGGDLPGHQERFGLMHRLLKPVVRRILACARGRVANSEGLGERARLVYPGLDFSVIPNGVDLEEFTPEGRSRSHPPTILFVSRLITRKGLQFLLPALARLRDEGLAFRLQVVGDGPQREEWTQLARELGMEAMVEFTGAVAHHDLPALYRDADIFVLPSLSEGMPNVVLEAIAAGLPVVGTAVPGMAELVGEGENGFIVPPGAPDVFVEPLRQLLDDAALRERMGEASRAHAEQFGWRQLAESYLAFGETAGL